MGATVIDHGRILKGKAVDIKLRLFDRKRGHDGSGGLVVRRFVRKDSLHGIGTGILDVLKGDLIFAKVVLIAGKLYTLGEIVHVDLHLGKRFAVGGGVRTAHKADAGHIVLVIILDVDGSVQHSITGEDVVGGVLGGKRRHNGMGTDRGSRVSGLAVDGIVDRHAPGYLLSLEHDIVAVIVLLLALKDNARNIDRRLPDRQGRLDEERFALVKRILKDGTHGIITGGLDILTGNLSAAAVILVANKLYISGESRLVNLHFGQRCAVGGGVRTVLKGDTAQIRLRRQTAGDQKHGSQREKQQHKEQILMFHTCSPLWV